MIRQSESLKFPVPISSELHSLAKQFGRKHGNPEKAKQVYFNTLAVSAVKFYLRCMGVETFWQVSSSCTVIQTMMDVADLEVIGLGKVECRPLLSDEKVVHIPPEVWSDRIGYVAVQFDRSLRVATLLGFSKTAVSGEIPINELRSLEEFILQLSEIPEKVKQPIDLSQWLMNVVDVGWQTVESLLSSQQGELAFRFRCAEQTLAQHLENSTITVQKGTLLDLGGKSKSNPIALVVGLLPTSEQEINIYVKVFPIGSEKYLPEELELIVLDDSGTAVMQATARSTKSIQLNFSSELGERFSIKVALCDVSFTEVFLV